MILVQSDGNQNTNPAFIGVNNTGGANAQGNFRITRNGTVISLVELDCNPAAVANSQNFMGPGMLSVMDINAPAGSNTYALQAQANSGSGIFAEFITIVAYEL
jgi:hypothetical protein